MNTPSRWGTQAPFSNITLDWTVPRRSGEPARRSSAARSMDFTYGDCTEGNGHGQQGVHRDHDRGRRQRPRLPVPDPDVFHHARISTGATPKTTSLLFEMTAQVRHAVLLQLHQLRHGAQRRALACAAACGWICASCGKKSGGFFGSGESTGSVGVVTINLPRIAYLSARTRTNSTSRLDRMMDISARSPEGQAHRHHQAAATRACIPTRSTTSARFDNHFSTIGLVGMNEACLNAKLARAST